MWYRLKVKPKKFIPIVQSTLEMQPLENQTINKATEEDKIQNQSVLEILDYIYEDPFLNL